MTVTSTVFAQSADAPPSTPAIVRATLHDKAGGELSWQRSPVGNRRHTPLDDPRYHGFIELTFRAKRVVFRNGIQ